MRTLTLMLGLLVLSLSGCIKKEPLNAEADIVKCILPEDMLKSAPIIKNNAVQILILPGSASLSAIAPEFELTPGATISPASGTVRNFNTPQVYKVTSEDGLWSKEYTITISEAELPTQYNFEHWKQEGKFETPYEELPGGAQMAIWASGNAGFSLIAGTSPSVDAFPTFSTPECYSGKLAAELVTRSTGKAGQLVGMPIAAGNLFIGTFDGSLAMKDPLGATHFGLPIGKKPLKFTGHYRYTSGGNITGKDGKEIVPAKRDNGQIYAILYETDTEVKYLNGANVTTSPNIVARAMVTVGETKGTAYTAYDIDFKYEKTYDPVKQKAFKYSLAVVFSASERGAYFEGAVGSTMFVDAVEIVCEQ